MKRLLNSSKFWLAVFGLAQAVILHYLNVPDEIWQNVVILVGIVIAGITIEDAAQKLKGQPEGIEP